MRRSYLRAVIAGLCACAFPSLLVWAQQAAPSPVPDPAWPHDLKVNGTDVVVYQPQAIDWPNHERLIARAAIGITPPGAKAPVLGTIDVSLATHTEAATNEVDLSDPKLVSSHFPSLDTEQAAQFESRISRALPKLQTKQVPLQAILLSLKETKQPAGVALHNDPPEILYSDKPASLVVFDGEPVLAPVGKTGLSFAVNTNWNMFTDGHTWYLLNNGLWLAGHAYDGPFTPVGTLPAAFKAIPADQNFADVRKAIPPKSGTPAGVPVVFVRTRPTEIIVTQGPLQLVAVPGTGLQTVKNTNSVLFFQPSSGQFFLQVSGRWFAAHGLDGPWSFATDKLPPDFALIPPDAPEAQVLASVPGTTQAQLAVLQAQVPHQATLKTQTAKLTVTYAGKPLFKPIPGTTLAYAVNTSFEVIESGGKYYVCYQGAWFVGPTPNGAWLLASSVPPDIYTIPPSSPLYNVTYVKVYAATPATVTFGYTAGYTMGFVTTGVLVYGTGYYYPPVVIPGPVPVYYAYPYSYAGNVWYNPTTGGWARGGTVYGPYGGVAKGGTYYNPNNGAWARGGAIYGPYGGVGAVSYYNPTTGAYAHGSAAWGPDGGSAHGSYYNPRTGVSGSSNQNWNAYSRWGSSTVTGPNQTVHTESGSNARGSAGAFSSSTGAEGAGYHGVNGNRGGAVKTQSGDTYAGHDGNVYQHTSDGWSKWNNNGWQPVTPPSNQSDRGNAQGNAQGNSLGANQTGGQTPQTGQGAQARQSASTRQASQSTQANRATQTQRSGGNQMQGGTRQPVDRSTYQQLEQDRQARFSGMQQRAGGGRFSGGGGERSGRFRR